jgi:hypothetical protein
MLSFVALIQHFWCVTRTQTVIFALQKGLIPEKMVSPGD